MFTSIKDRVEVNLSVYKQTMHRQLHRKPLVTQTLERKALDSAAGEWWRFDQYEIKDGVIQPAAGARLEWYDPWRPFRETKKYKDVASPYQGLLQLVAKLKFTSPGRLSRLTESSQAAVLDTKIIVVRVRAESLDLEIHPILSCNCLGESNLVLPDFGEAVCRA